MRWWPASRWARLAAKLRRVGSAEEEERAFALALAELARRERTVAQILQLLVRRGVERGPAEGAVARLIGLGLLDDARYARLFAEDRRTLHGWGSERIARALAERGVERGLIARALGGEAVGGRAGGGGERIGWEDGGREAELERALALLRRRFPQPPRGARERNRALGILVRKGFELELARDALTAHAGALPAEEWQDEPGP